MIKRLEKLRKIKLLLLIMIVEREKYKRKQNKSIEDIIAFAINQSYWCIELQKVSSKPALNI